MPLTIANILTLLRVALIPVVVAVYLIGGSGYLTAGLFLLAGVTDWADGYLARKRNEQSAFGAFLDPVADKLMVSAVLVLLAADPEMTQRVLSPVLFTIVVAIIIGREITISALREWMAIIGANKNVAVHMLGKLKTSVQMVAIPFLLWNGDLFYVIDTRLIGDWLIWISAVLTVWSMVYYLQKALPAIQDRVGR